MAMMNKGKHISWIAGAALAAALLPYSAAYAQLSCSAAIEPDIGAGAPSPIRLGDTVPIVVNIGVNGISSGDFMNVTQVEYALDCQNAEDDPGNCIDDGEAIAFNNNVTTDCTDADGFPITWTPSLSPGDTNPNVMFFNADNPVKILENDSCNLFFDVQVLQLGTDADPEIISSAAAFSGICDNNFGGNAEASLGIEVVPDPSIDIEKHTNGQDADNPTGPIIPVGDAVLWEYFVSNTGDVDLSNVTVTDDQGVAVSCPQTDLAVGESMTCTGNGTAAAGQYANIGTATGTPPVGPPVDDTDPSHYFGADPAISIEKHTNGQDADNPTGPIIPVGDAVLWEYFVTNTGNVPLVGVTVTDDQGVAVSCPQTDLAVGESMTCTGNGTAAAGQYANIGTATGTPPVGPPVDDTDPSHYFGADPAISIEKHTNGQDADNPTGPIIPVGDAVLWEYFVTNTGNVPLVGVTVTDDQGVAVSCPQTDLAVGESMTCTGNGTAAAGQYANIGTATGTPPVGPPVDDTDPSHYFGADPAISIEKHTNGQDADNPTGPIIPVGDAVLWEYFVTNTGNVPLVGVTVTDDQGVAVSCPQTDLAVGESMTCTGNGTAAAGQYANIGTATGTPPVGPPVDDTDPSHYFGAEADLTFSKACESRDDAENPDQPSVAGDQLAKWSLTLTSTGNRALTCTITDPGTTLDGVVVELAANGDSATQTGTSTKLASELADIDGVTNKASVTCTGEGIADITDEASATCPLLVPPQATLTVSKTATKETKWTWGIEKSADQNTVEEPVLILEEGTPRTVEYTVTVNADDSYTISGVITIGTDDQAVTVDVEDTMSDGTIVDLSCDNGTQNPQATNIVEGVQINANGQAECTYEVTLDDAPPADLINTATVTVTDPAQDPQDPPIIFESNPTPVVQGDVIDECINVDDIHGDNVPQMIDQEVCAPDDLTDGEKSFMYTLTFGDESTQPDVVLACDEFITHPNTATFETVEVDGTGAPHQQGESMWTVDAQLNCLPPPSDICEAGKPLTLIVSYDADYDTNHSQVSNEVIIDPTSGDPLPNTVYIVAQDGTNKNNKNSVLAEGTVSVNGTLEVFGAEKKNGGNHRVPPRTIFFIYDEEGGNLLQTVQFHTSCSQPLFTGDEFGAITVHSATH